MVSKMKIITIKNSLNRDMLIYEDYNIMTKCLQQSNIADNDWHNFLRPMADYIAQIIFIK